MKLELVNVKRRCNKEIELLNNKQNEIIDQKQQLESINNEIT